MIASRLLTARTVLLLLAATFEVWLLARGYIGPALSWPIVAWGVIEKMKIQRAYKTEMAPLPSQAALMARHATVARFTYNWGLGRVQEVYKEIGQFPSVYELKKELTALKNNGGAFEVRVGGEKTFEVDPARLFDGVNSYAMQSAFDDLGKALSNFYRELKKQRQGQRAEPAGFPRFKSKEKSRASFRLYGIINVTEDAIRIPTLGVVSLKEKGYLPVSGVKILNVTLSERAGRWFVALQVEQEIPDPPARLPVSARVDVDTREIRCSDGAVYQIPTPMRKTDRKLARLNRERDRRQKGSKNRAKTVAKLQRLHYKVACQRQDVLHRATKQITDDYTNITARDMKSKQVLQDVQPHHKRAMAVSDSAWFEIRRQLEYKSKWKGGATEIEK